jgi:hypothetical protein
MVIATTTATAPPHFEDSLPLEESQCYKNNFSAARINLSVQISQLEQELIDRHCEIINIALDKFMEIFGRQTINSSIIKIVARKWKEDIISYDDHDDMESFNYLRVAYLMHRISQQKPIQINEADVMINELFASFIGFKLIRICICTISKEVFRKFLLYLNFDDPSPLEIARLLKTFILFPNNVRLEAEP